MFVLSDMMFKMNNSKFHWLCGKKGLLSCFHVELFSALQHGLKSKTKTL